VRSFSLSLSLSLSLSHLGIYGGRFASDYYYDHPAYTLELLFAQIRLLHKRQDNPQSSKCIFWGPEIIGALTACKNVLII